MGYNPLPCLKGVDIDIEFPKAKASRCPPAVYLKRVPRITITRTRHPPIGCLCYGHLIPVSINRRVVAKGMLVTAIMRIYGTVVRRTSMTSNYIRRIPSHAVFCCST